MCCKKSGPPASAGGPDFFNTWEIEGWFFHPHPSRLRRATFPREGEGLSVRLSILLCSWATASVRAFPLDGGRWLAGGQTDEGETKGLHPFLYHTSISQNKINHIKPTQHPVEDSPPNGVPCGIADNHSQGTPKCNAGFCGFLDGIFGCLPGLTLRTGFVHGSDSPFSFFVRTLRASFCARLSFLTWASRRRAALRSGCSS